MRDATASPQGGLHALRVAIPNRRVRLRHPLRARMFADVSVLSGCWIGKAWVLQRTRPCVPHSCVEGFCRLHHTSTAWRIVMGCDSHSVIVGMPSYDAVLLQYAAETQSPITLHGNPEGQLVTGNSIPRIQDQEILGKGSLLFYHLSICYGVPPHSYACFYTRVPWNWVHGICWCLGNVDDLEMEMETPCTARWTERWLPTTDPPISNLPSTAPGSKQVLSLGKGGASVHGSRPPRGPRAISEGDVAERLPWLWNPIAQVDREKLLEEPPRRSALSQLQE
ncbi:hypothetical protein BS50DRAFT_123762 [Corynespora cassiicola Philippines]|uniref:Uncharacterized protein n=1 Tax=Corynespora cassiicola Philippines TaxID=1448308 RepID=A0A2T2NAY6_CORCC|nr:hypothetical protein BS50DRAFT_123762 [Corynespora cassiicola Philippines]